ncbi:MAG: phosphoenolpyruvate--protein phosphotransferase [Gemmataceae bacterium]
MHKGLPVSPGVAIARAHRLDQVPARGDGRPLDPAAQATEVARFEQACVAAANELDDTVERLRTTVGEDEAAIFRAHRQLLRNPGRESPLVAKVKAIIFDKKLDAGAALQVALDEYTALFANIADPYVRDRLTDLKDVVGRVQAHLDGNAIASDEGGEPVVLVAAEILPSQAAMFDRLPVAGIVTEAGGTTGHAAILARALGIPAVSGIRGILKEIHTGDLLVIDGREGTLLINPGTEVESAYRKMQREYVDLRDRLIVNAEQPAVTADGVELELLANVNGSADAVTAKRTGACGVGLYRTEYLFLTHPSIPSESEQLAAYQLVIESSPNRRVTIRTLDLGGDKHVPYLGAQEEANPFLGWRSIRLTMTYPELFSAQLRAILRAGEYGDVSLLFPMITTLEEVRQVKQAVAETRKKIGLGDGIRTGVMIEVPAAAMCVADLLDEVDFVSIGSNDLIQYVMAADRDNPKVAHLCEPFSPAVFRLLNYIITACVAKDKPVTLCGEMAAKPRCFVPLLGMGLRRFSMSPAFVPTIKEVARRVTMKQARDVAAAVLRLRTVAEIRDYLAKQLDAVCPNVARLDTVE